MATNTTATVGIALPRPIGISGRYRVEAVLVEHDVKSLIYAAQAANGAVVSEEWQEPLPPIEVATIYGKRLAETRRRVVLLVEVINGREGGYNVFVGMARNRGELVEIWEASDAEPTS